MGRATYKPHSWLWNGKKINYVTAGCGTTPIVLVHGFGASQFHYTKNIPALAAAGYKVYSIDLLGFGSSEKDPNHEYSIESWGDLVVDFCREFVSSSPVILVGNSIGSLVSLDAGAKLHASKQLKGLCLLNCAGAMNNKAISDDFRIKLAMPLFRLIDWLLLKPNVSKFLFDTYRKPDTIKKVLQSVYQNKEAVDDALVDAIYQPSCDEGAREVFVRVITGPPGPRPESLIPQLDQVPMMVLWGDRDPFTPLNGPVGQYFESLPSLRSATTFRLLPDVGHCPHDDRPELVHAELIPWLSQLD